MTRSTQKPLLKYAICVFLAVVTFAAFAGLVHASFITLDDSTYVTQNPHVQRSLSWNAIKWAFQGIHTGFWLPITWISYMLDWQLHGLNPGGYHLTNLVFHVANTVLLFLLLQKMTGRLWPSAFVALLFGIHPMHVESVAWVAERKDVLSAFFFLLTLLAYVRYVELKLGRAGPEESVTAARCSKSDLQSVAIPSPLPSDGRGEGQGEVRGNAQSVYYALALLFFALGLMSKPMLVTLPFVLLLLDFWPFGRFNALDVATSEAGTFQRFNVLTFQRLFVEKLPFFLIAAAGSYITFLAQRGAGAVMPKGLFSISERLNHVLISYGWYISKLFWPVHLSAFYPLRPEAFGLGAVVVLVLLLAITALAFVAVRKHPYLLFGWLWFLGMMVPVCGLVQSGEQAYADRFAYLPYIGLFVMIAWGIPVLVAKIPLYRSPQASLAVLWTGGTLIAAACFIQTVQEASYWKDGVALFKRAVELDPKNAIAWASLGAEYSQIADNGDAIDCLNRSLALRGNSDMAWQWLGMALAGEGDYVHAEHAYRMALQTTVVTGLDSVMTLNNLAWLLAAAPDPAARNGQEAVTFAERACQLTHNQEALAIGTLADAYAEAGRFDAAAAAAQKAQDVALADGQNDLAARNAQLMELYKSHRAFHMEANQ